MLMNSSPTRMISKMSKCKLSAASSRSVACCAVMLDAFSHTADIPMQMRLMREAKAEVTRPLLGTPKSENAQREKITCHTCRQQTYHDSWVSTLIHLLSDISSTLCN